MDTNAKNIDIQSTNKEWSPDHDRRQSPTAKVTVLGRSSVVTNVESTNEQDKILERQNNNSSTGDTRFASPIFTAEELYAVDDDEIIEGNDPDLILNKQINIDNILIDEGKRGSITDTSSERGSLEINQQPTQDEDSDNLDFLNAMLHLEDVDLNELKKIMRTLYMESLSDDQS